MTRAASNLKEGSTPPVSSVLIGSGAESAQWSASASSASCVFGMEAPETR